MCVLAHKPAKRGRVISCAQVIGAGFGVEVFAALLCYDLVDEKESARS